MLILQCDNCNKGYKVFPGDAEKSRFCSRSCFDEYVKTNNDIQMKIAKARFQGVIDKHEKHLGIDDLGEWLQQKYINEVKTFREIMKMLDTKSNRTIKKLMDYYKIPIRQGSEAIASQWHDNDERRKKQSIYFSKKSTGNTLRRISTEELTKRYKSKKRTLLDRKIENGQSYILYQCDVCLETSWQSLSNCFYKGCPTCSKKFSKGEHKLEEYFKENCIEYSAQYVIEKCRNIEPLPFDFALFSNRKLLALVEYQGIQHYEPVEFFGGEEQFIKQVRNDKIKRNYCKVNNIVLIEIPYTVEDIFSYMDREMNKLNKTIQLSIL